MIGAAVSLEEYQNSSYDPDMEFVDGVLESRNMGDWLHSLIQRNIIVSLAKKYPHIFAVPELRSRTGARRYRLPDIAVLLKTPSTKFVEDATQIEIAIEILSEDDRMSNVMGKLAEYEASGIPAIWLIDPRERTFRVFERGDLVRVTGFSRGETVLTYEEVFQSV